MEVEELAVSETSGMIARCPHLKPIISSNDKTPFTDGYIYVYGSLGRKNEDAQGRVSVQVKGRTHTGKLREEISFGVAATDLRGFQKISGVLYFFVAVDREGHCSPYYAILSPFTIEHYLHSFSDRKKIPVTFKKFRNDAEEIEGIVALALKTKDQRTALGFDPVLLEKMSSITVHSTTELDLTAPVTLMPGEIDFALELNTEAGMSLPLEGGLRIIPQDYVQHAIEFKVASSEVVYDNLTARRLDASAVEVYLDAGLSLVFKSTEAQQQVTINFDAPSNFAKRLKATQFLAAATNRNEIELNDSVLILGQSSDSTWVAGIERQLAFLRQLQELFDHLAVDSKLVEFDELDHTQILNLQNLHRAFIGGEEPYNEDGETARGLMDVGSWQVMILVTPGGAPNRWRYVDPFDPQAPHMFGWSTDPADAREAIPVTAYDTVEQEALPTILNLRLDSIVSAYEAIADSGQQTMRLANERVLALILAADACPAREIEFLEAAQALNEWVISNQGEKAAHLVNRWQILWRTKSLTEAHRDAIRAMRREMTRSADTMAQEAELSCALLAGDADEAEYLINQLSKEKLKIVETWPIWKLRVNAKANPIVG